MSYRLHDGDICMADAMPFNQHHEVRTTFDISSGITSEMFLNIRHRLAAGDVIHVCQFDSKDFQRLVAVVEVRIVFSDQDGIEVIQVGEVYRVKPVEKKMAIPQTGSTYRAKKVFQGGFVVVDEKGNEYEHFDTKAKAEQWIADINMTAAA